MPRPTTTRPPATQGRPAQGRPAHGPGQRRPTAPIPTPGPGLTSPATPGPAHPARPTPGLAHTPPGYEPSDTALLMLYRGDTFPAGTRVGAWLRLDRATNLELAFFTDVLAAFTADGRLGGRAAIGHGQVRCQLTRTILAGQQTPVDWRAHLLENRAAALTALEALA